MSADSVPASLLSIVTADLKLCREGSVLAVYCLSLA